MHSSKACAPSSGEMTNIYIQMMSKGRATDALDQKRQLKCVCLPANLPTKRQKQVTSQAGHRMRAYAVHLLFE